MKSPRRCRAGPTGNDWSRSRSASPSGRIFGLACERLAKRGVSIDDLSRDCRLPSDLVREILQRAAARNVDDIYVGAINRQRSRS